MIDFKETTKYLLAGAYSLFSGSAQRVVLYYHSVKPAETDSFRRQMEYLAEHCQIVKTSAILDVEPVDRPVVAVTFDDGFVSCYQNGTTVMKQLGIPAGIFVPTGYIGKACGWSMPQGHPDRYEAIMDRDQLRNLSDMGFEILSHTVNHLNLTKIDEDVLRDELSESKISLEKLLDRPVEVISYPHGSHNSQVVDIARQCGYRLGFTIEPERVDQRRDDLAIGRFLVSPGDSVAKLKLKSKGAYMTERILRHMKRQLKG